MTDKQIIIDGVDVSGCIYFKKNNKMSMCRACNSGVGTPYCEYHKDCYYKQLKRKEQECKVLKGENFTLADLIKTQEEQLDDDNVIIERFLIASGKSKDITEPDEFEEVFQDIEQTYSEHEELNKECKDLKQALDEIEKIANKQRKFDLRGKTSLTPIINEVGGDFIDILDIIKKVKEQ